MSYFNRAQSQLASTTLILFCVLHGWVPFAFELVQFRFRVDTVTQRHQFLALFVNMCVCVLMELNINLYYNKV